MPPAQQPTYLRPYLAAAEKYGAGFGTLLWASPRTQAARFKALLRAIDINGKTVLDVGCGRADFLEHMLKHRAIPRSYIGLEAVKDLAVAAAVKRFPNCQIICGDFVQNPELLEMNADVLFYSGSLNTMDRDDFFNCLRGGFTAAKQAVVFNFLASATLAAAPHLAWYHRDEIDAFARTLSSRVKLWDDYLPGDCTVAMWKDQP
jgi:hypothetical protein